MEIQSAIRFWVDKWHIHLYPYLWQGHAGLLLDFVALIGLTLIPKPHGGDNGLGAGAAPVNLSALVFGYG